MIKKKHWTDWIWDAWCVISAVGIWPRFIEPNWLKVTRLTLPISTLPAELFGLKILQFSDLHWSHPFSSRLAKQLIRKANLLKPDVILFTGDFICRSKLENPEGLKKLLGNLRAPSGCFAVLGNHDYARFVTINKQGDYAIEDKCTGSTIRKGFKRLFRSVTLTKKIAPEVREVKKHEELLALLKQTPFTLLNNESRLIPVRGGWINICGLEEYTLGRFDPENAFKGYDRDHPGIVLLHNPDAVMGLKDYPGDVVLSGHTHGGQVNIPWMWKRFTCMENHAFKSGLKILNNKWVYINRGISSVMKFRWFASPELTLITFKQG